jgi:hypothetical protein
MVSLLPRSSKMSFLGITIGNGKKSILKKSWKRSENGPKIEKNGGEMKKRDQNFDPRAQPLWEKWSF